jgi:AcrR family transcriptional regulator
MRPTKIYIADHALALFNTKGFVNVRLQHIADAAFVSVGHLAYHFKNKDAIVDHLYEMHRKTYEEMLQDFRVMPLFVDFNEMLQQFFQLQLKYAFLYTDILELIRAYPAIGEKYTAYHAWQQMQLDMMLGFHMARGALALPQNASSQHLAKLLQVQLITCLYRQKTTEPVALHMEGFLQDAWSLLLPYCTQQGLAELSDFR